MRAAERGLARSALVASLALATACTPAPVAPTQTTAPSALWFDRALDRANDVVVDVDLASHRATGPLRRAIVDVLLAVFDRALGRGPDLHRAVDAASEMIIVAPAVGEPTVVLRDVPSTLDPRSLPAADGGRQFALGPVGEVVEYIYAPGVGSLFVLRDGTWLLGAGVAAQDLKNAFATNGGAPVLPKRSPQSSVATLWVPAPVLRVVAARERLKLLAPVLVPASSLDAALGEDDVVEAHLRYPTEREALEAHATLVDVVRAFARRNDPKTSWIGQTKLAHDGPVITARLAIPPSAFADFQDAH